MKTRLYKEIVMRFTSDVLESVKAVGISILALSMFLAAVLTGANFYSQYQCNNYQEITGKTTKYATLDACYVDSGNGFQRWDEYKARAVASEGLKRN